MYREGLGVEKDLAEAQTLFSKAAESGDAKAQSNLGALYATSSDQPRDLPKAYFWLTRSADQGEGTALRMLTGLKHSMTRKEIAEGKRLLKHAGDLPVSPAK
jgi:uncharacterized protein